MSEKPEIGIKESGEGSSQNRKPRIIQGQPLGESLDVVLDPQAERRQEFLDILTMGVNGLELPEAYKDMWRDVAHKAVNYEISTGIEFPFAENLERFIERVKIYTGGKKLVAGDGLFPGEIMDVDGRDEVYLGTTEDGIKQIYVFDDGEAFSYQEIDIEDIQNGSDKEEGNVVNVGGGTIDDGGSPPETEPVVADEIPAPVGGGGVEPDINGVPPAPAPEGDADPSTAIPPTPGTGEPPAAALPETDPVAATLPEGGESAPLPFAEIEEILKEAKMCAAKIRANQELTEKDRETLTKERRAVIAFMQQCGLFDAAYGLLEDKETLSVLRIKRKREKLSPGENRKFIEARERRRQFENVLMELGADGDEHSGTRLHIWTTRQKTLVDLGAFLNDMEGKAEAERNQILKGSKYARLLKDIGFNPKDFTQGDLQQLEELYASFRTKKEPDIEKKPASQEERILPQKQVEGAIKAIRSRIAAFSVEYRKDLWRSLSDRQRSDPAVMEYFGGTTGSAVDGTIVEDGKVVVINGGANDLSDMGAENFSAVPAEETPEEAEILSVPDGGAQATAEDYFAKTTAPAPVVEAPAAASVPPEGSTLSGNAFNAKFGAGSAGDEENTRLSYQGSKEKRDNYFTKWEARPKEEREKILTCIRGKITPSTIIKVERSNGEVENWYIHKFDDIGRGVYAYGPMDKAEPGEYNRHVSIEELITQNPELLEGIDQQASLGAELELEPLETPTAKSDDAIIDAEFVTPLTEEEKAKRLFPVAYEQPSVPAVIEGEAATLPDNGSEKEARQIPDSVVEKFSQLFSGMNRETLAGIDGFDQMSEGQQLLALEQFKYTAKENIDGQKIKLYKDKLEELSQRDTKGFWGAVKNKAIRSWMTLTKSYQLGVTEDEARAAWRGEGDAEAQDMRKDVLEAIVRDISARKEFGISEKEGKITTLYVDPSMIGEDAGDDLKNSAEKFNALASDYASLLGEKSGAVESSDRQTFERSARDMMEKMMAPAEQGGAGWTEAEALKWRTDLESSVGMSRFTEKNPDVDLEFRAAGARIGAVIGAKNLIVERGGIFGVSMLGRAAGVGFFGLAALPAVAAGVGGVMAWRRGRQEFDEKETLQIMGEEGSAVATDPRVAAIREELATIPEGTTDDSANTRREELARSLGEAIRKVRKTEAAVVQGDALVQKIELLRSRIAEIDSQLETGPVGDEARGLREKREKLEKSLSARLSYTEDKLNDNMVNLGTSPADRVDGKSRLIQEIGSGKAALDFTPETKNEITERLAEFLEFRDNKMERAQMFDLAKKAAFGAVLGAAFSKAGQFAGEQLRNFFVGGAQGSREAAEALIANRVGNGLSGDQLIAKGGNGATTEQVVYDDAGNEVRRIAVPAAAGIEGVSKPGALSPDALRIAREEMIVFPGLDRTLDATLIKDFSGRPALDVLNGKFGAGTKEAAFAEGFRSNMDRFMKYPGSRPPLSGETAEAYMAFLAQKGLDVQPMKDHLIEEMKSAIARGDKGAQEVLTAQYKNLGETPSELDVVAREGLADTYHPAPLPVSEATTHATAAATEVAPQLYTVQSGDALERILREKAGMQVKDANAFWRSLTPEELRSVGVKSGNPDLIRPNETIDLNKIRDLYEAKYRASLTDSPADAQGSRVPSAQEVAQSNPTAANVSEYAKTPEITPAQGTISFLNPNGTPFTRVELEPGKTIGENITETMHMKGNPSDALRVLRQINKSDPYLHHPLVGNNSAVSILNGKDINIPKGASTDGMSSFVLNMRAVYAETGLRPLPNETIAQYAERTGRFARTIMADTKLPPDVTDPVIKETTTEILQAPPGTARAPIIEESAQRVYERPTSPTVEYRDDSNVTGVGQVGGVNNIAGVGQVAPGNIGGIRQVVGEGNVVDGRVIGATEAPQVSRPISIGAMEVTRERPIDEFRFRAMTDQFFARQSHASSLGLSRDAVEYLNAEGTNDPLVATLYMSGISPMRGETIGQYVERGTHEFRARGLIHGGNGVGYPDVRYVRPRPNETSGGYNVPRPYQRPPDVAGTIQHLANVTGVGGKTAPITNILRQTGL